MSDPRLILKKELINIGIVNSDATVIALDTGSSQVLVNMVYLEEFNYTAKVRSLAIKLIGEFYSGELTKKLS